MIGSRKILLRVAVAVTGFLALAAVASAALIHHTLYDARLWFDACRVPGVPPEFYEQVESEARRSLPVDGKTSAPGLVDELTAWFKDQAGNAGTEAEKLALMDATFRVLPMQYVGAYRSLGLVGPASNSEMRKTVTYSFAYRAPAGLTSRLTNYTIFQVSWLTDARGGLGTFNSVSDQYSTAILGRTLRRARDDSQPLCPQPSKQVPARDV